VNVWRAISKSPFRFSVALCLAIVLVVLEEGLFEAFLEPLVQPIFGIGYNADAMFTLNTIRRVLVGSFAVPVALILTRVIWKTLGLQP
jgi:hypothetical protein